MKDKLEIIRQHIIYGDVEDYLRKRDVRCLDPVNKGDTWYIKGETGVIEYGQPIGKQFRDHKSSLELDNVGRISYAVCNKFGSIFHILKRWKNLFLPVDRKYGYNQRQSNETARTFSIESGPYVEAVLSLKLKIRAGEEPPFVLFLREAVADLLDPLPSVLRIVVQGDPH